MPPELSEVMDMVIKTVNHMMAHPFKGRLFAELCKEVGGQYQSLLFYCNSCWISRVNVVAHTCNLRGVAELFSDEKNLAHAETFLQETFYF
jgi:hypothetical protein